MNKYEEFELDLTNEEGVTTYANISKVTKTVSKVTEWVSNVVTASQALNCSKGCSKGCVTPTTKGCNTVNTCRTMR
ncbi:hypothetical protein JGS6364_PCS1200561 (plasmid) [[Clostridium] sordellii]|nr:hypothetical protein [Paeniclostridium sordellii]AUO31844.1 hypothetical protein [Paeniclostridium sordellii]CEK32665.1 hypothetical protein JGS6364_PCS1200561 (plasmid) [[Clostridium] sordellii] [Paeniclostridium sordellii]